jgi:hypothetical protein
VAGERQIFLDEPLRHGMNGNEPDLSRLPLILKCITPWAALDVPDFQTAQLLAADAMMALT